MKKVLLLGVAFLLIASVTSAQLPPQGYIGLFVDETHVNGCLNGEGYLFFYCYILPPAEGMDSAEFATELSSGDLRVYFDAFNPDISLSMGGVPGDLTVTYTTCQMEWSLVFSAEVRVTDTTQPYYITLGPRSDSPTGEMTILSCDVVETVAQTYCELSINDAECVDPVANRESTWGAIKNMYE